MTWNCWLFKKYAKAKCCQCGKTLWLSEPPDYSPICTQCFDVLEVEEYEKEAGNAA